MSESLNPQQPPEDDWTQILYKIDWKIVDLTLHAKSEAGEEISVSLPTMADVVEKPIRLPDNTSIYKDLEDRLVKRVLLDGSTVNYIYEGIAKLPSKITLQHFSGSDEVEHSAYSLKDGELNYSFVGSIYEANIFHHKAIKGLLAADLEVYTTSGRPSGVICRDGAEFEFGYISSARKDHLRDLVRVETEVIDDVAFFGKLNHPNNTFAILPNTDVVRIGTNGDENIHLSVPTVGVKANLNLQGQYLNLTNSCHLPINVYRKGSKKITINEGIVFPLESGDRLQFSDKKTLVDVEKSGESYLLSGGKKPTVLKKETPYVVTEMQFSLGNHGTDYEVTNIVGAKVDISPVINSISGATGTIYNSGSKPIRIVRGSETILLSPGERAGIENDDLLSYDIETKLKFNHTFEGLVLELVEFRDKTAGVKVEIDDVEAYILQNLIGDGFADSNLIKRHVSNNMLEALGFLRLYEVGAAENEDFGFFVHETTNMQVQKIQDKIVEIRLPSRERTSGANFSESVISIDWYESYVHQISIAGKKGYRDVLKHLIAGRRQAKIKRWDEFEIASDHTLPYVPEDHILLAKCINNPSQLKNLDIPVAWSDNPDEVALEALPDGKVIYVLMHADKAEYFKCIFGDATKYIFSLTDLGDKKIKEHIFSPDNPNNTGDLWIHLKERTSFSNTKSSTAMTEPVLLKSVNIDISRFGLIIRKQEDGSFARALIIHPPFTTSQPRARHSISFGQRSSAGSDKNSEILIGNACPMLFQIIYDKDGPNLIAESNLLLSSIGIQRSGVNLNFDNSLELQNDDKIVVSSKTASERCIYKQVFQVEIKPEAVYLLHLSSSIKLHSMTKYASSFNYQLTEFRTSTIKKEKVQSQLSVESLIFGRWANTNNKSSSTNNLNFSPFPQDNPALSQAEFIWIEDPEPFRIDYYSLIHHTIVNDEREVRVLPPKEGMVDISITAGTEKIAFLRTTETGSGYMEYCLTNPYSSNDLLLLQKGASKATVVEGGPEIELKRGDTFFINNHAFTLASVDEFENFEFCGARLDSPNYSNESASDSHDSSNKFNLSITDLPPTSIEADGYVLPLNELNELLNEVPEEIFSNVELRMLAGEVVVFSRMPLVNGEKRNIFFVADTDTIPIDLLVMTIIRHAQEENLTDIVMPILASDHSVTRLYDTVVSHIEGVKLANCNIEVRYSIANKNTTKKLADLIISQVNLQQQDLLYSRIRATFIKLIEQLNFEISNVSRDIFISLDTTNSIANTIKSLRHNCNEIDFSIIDPSRLVEDLNNIMDILRLSGRFVFLQKANNKGKLQLLLKDRISEGYWKDATVIKISENPNSEFIMEEEKHFAIKEFAAKLSAKNIYVPEAYLHSIKTSIKNLEKSGMPAYVIEELLSEAIEKENVRHLLNVNFKNNLISIKNRIPTSKPALTVFTVDTGLTSIADVEEIRKSDVLPKKSETSTGAGSDVAKRMKDFLAAEKAKRIEERIKIETENGPKEGTVLLRQSNFNIAIVKLDQPWQREPADFQMPSWKQYSELPTFHYAGRSYRYAANGTVFTAIKGKIEIANDLHAHKEDSVKE